MTGRPAFLTSPLLEAARVPHLFTTRHFPRLERAANGGSPFGPAAWTLLGARGLLLEPPAFARQVHGAEVVEARAGGSVGRGDALVSDRPGLPLAVFTADCLPIVLFDPAGGRLAVAHAGWRGTVQSVARAVADALARAGAPRESLLAAIGPSIGPCCYEVDLPVIQGLRSAFPGAWSGWVTPTGPGKWMLDLWKANEDQLRSAGVDPSRIDNLRLCTACRLDLFFSYRREGKGGSLATVAAVPASS
ncbi:MAG: peptidoglycan editing factor PgeF [Candidatus Rokubacteria bacterium]|nr:peptidoglycan editing factor PgeF [Candidatus Rokubacteria bacterium]